MQPFGTQPVDVIKTEILLETVDLTAPTTTPIFEITDREVFDVRVISSADGAQGTIDFQVNYSASDTENAGALVTPTALPLDHYVGLQGAGDKANPLDFGATPKVVETAIKFNPINAVGNADGGLKPNKKYTVTLAGAGLAGTNKVTVILVKYNNR